MPDSDVSTPLSPKDVLIQLANIRKIIKDEVSTYKRMGLQPDLLTSLQSIQNKLDELYKIIEQNYLKQSSLKDFN